MKYLKTIIFACIVLQTTFLFSQNDILVPMNSNGECGTEPAGPVKRYSQTQLNNAKYLTNDTQYVFNVFVHYIDNIIPANEQELSTLDIVGTLNLEYNDANIFFKYQGYENIPDSSLLTLSSSNITGVANTYANNERIDIFVCQYINSSTSSTQGVAWTWSNTTTGEISRKVIAIRSERVPILNNPNPSNEDLKRYTSTHEIGHYLGLHHPHQRWKFDNTGELEKVSDTYNGCDALEENLDNSEWNLYGDFVQDTNPDRSKQRYGFNYFSNCTVSWTNYNDDSCGNSIDQNLFNPSMDNIMAYYHVCRTGFSQGQKDRTRAFIEDEINGGFLTNHLNTIESLYEPYKGDYRLCAPWNSNERPVMQKGFNYKFIGCFDENATCNNPVINNLTGNEYQLFGGALNTANVSANETERVHKNLRAIIIEEVDSDKYANDKCYSNLLKSVKSGIKMKFLDGYYNNNYTIEVLDSIQINNTNLIQNLDQGLYRIIKQYEPEIESEKTFYKTQD